VPDPNLPADRAGRRAKRFLTPAEKYQAFVQVLCGEMTVAQCAEHWRVDRSTIMKAREVAKQGALAALAASRPGVRADGVDVELLAARGEIARLSEALKEMAIKVTLLEGKERWG
jgi:transposase